MIKPENIVDFSKRVEGSAKISKDIYSQIKIIHIILLALVVVVSFNHLEYSSSAVNAIFLFAIISLLFVNIYINRRARAPEVVNDFKAELYREDVASGPVVTDDSFHKNNADIVKERKQIIKDTLSSQDEEEIENYIEEIAFIISLYRANKIKIMSGASLVFFGVLKYILAVQI